MRAKAFFIIHDEGEADEIVQESFVKLIEHVQDLMRIDPIKVPVYVMVTVKNISITHWHKAKNLTFLDCLCCKKITAIVIYCEKLFKIFF